MSRFDCLTIVVFGFSQCQGYSASSISTYNERGEFLPHFYSDKHLLTVPIAREHSTVSDPLKVWINQLRRQLQKLLWLHGVCWVLIVFCGVTFCCGLFDWGVRTSDTGTRLILFGLVVSAVSWVSFHFLLRPLNKKFSDTDLALIVEKRFPRFQDRLASTVQFQEGHTNSAVGSPELQQLVIAEAVSQIQKIKVNDVLEIRDVKRVTTGAFFACVFSALFVLCNQSLTAVALNRLFLPLSDQPWPQQTVLQFLNSEFEPIVYDPADPLRVVRGQRFELFIENRRGELPESVLLEYRISDGKPIQETPRRTSLADNRGQVRDVFATSIPATHGPVWFRALGGDDRQMAWHELQVVPPPALQQLQVSLRPPAYTGRASLQLPAGVGHLEAIVGTQVNFSAKSSKPLRSATLVVKNQRPQKLLLSKDRKTFQASFPISEPGISTYRLDLIDYQGFENIDTPRYEIRAIADTVPNIVLERPESDMQVTAQAVLPLKVIVLDDLGVSSVSLIHQLTSESDSRNRVLDLFNRDDRPAELSIEQEWNLAELPLTEGMQIVFHIEATDDFDLGDPHIGQTQSRILTVVSYDQKRRELETRYNDLLAELEKNSRSQEQVRDQVQSLQVQLNKARQLRTGDIDLFKRLELDQRKISTALNHEQDGIEQKVLELLSGMDHHKIVDSGLSTRLNELNSLLASLREKELSVIEQFMTQLRKSFVSTPTPLKPEQADPKKFNPSKANALDEQLLALDQTQEHQTAVLEALNGVLEKSAEWTAFRKLSDSLNDVIDRQKSIRQETTGLAAKTLTKAIEELTIQQQADLARLAARQQNLAPQLEKMKDRLEKSLSQDALKNSGESETLQDFRDSLEQSATADLMNRAVKDLEQNRIGQASSGQQQIEDNLAELDAILKNQSTSDQKTLVKKLQEAESELAKLARRQADLFEKMKKSQNNSVKGQQDIAKLKDEQQAIRKAAAPLLRKLRRLQAFDAKDSLNRATQRMRSAEAEIEQNSTDQAEKHQQESIDDIEQSQRELANLRQREEQRLAFELLEQLAGELKGMIAREEELISQTLRLKELYQNKGRWSRSDLKSIRDLAQSQLQLSSGTEMLVEQLDEIKIYALALKAAARQMALVASRLKARTIDGRTVQLEQFVKVRLLNLMQSLAEQLDGPGSPQQPGASQTNQSENAEAQKGVPYLLQLRILKDLQLELNARSQQLSTWLQTAGELSKEQQEELDLISLEQGELADLAKTLAHEIQKPFEAEQNQPDGGGGCVPSI